ncbi:hypothetical protein SAMN05216327_1056 [Dyadobacter sp. SG02]|uniref:hypothetical protein n=1 Tax=Dyadobacter sp. SG02 TaxID=1855291 RepID=UPI0008BC78A7|nr:hypothetical protein [Dyadobacter sp. SG02]SEI96403.1 hypothetical protein SAMN05216327_1056 [Dyadobacter sp. SG02]
MKAYIRKTLNEYKSKLITAEESEIPIIRAAFSDWYYSVSDQDRAEMAPFWADVKKEAWEMIKEVKDALDELKTLKEKQLAEARK